MKIIRFCFYLLSILIAALAVIWSIFAIIIDGPYSPWNKVIAALYLLLQLFVIIKIRPRKLAYLMVLLLFCAVCAWWLNIKPQSNKNWTPDVARNPEITFNGDIVSIKNVRNFDYRSEHDFTEKWEERTYDLSKVVGYDVFLSYWGSPWMAHAVSSWEFSDDRHLAISIETRKEIGEQYSATLGFFKQFELYYVVADERDLIRLRTNFRNEQVYLYRLKEKPEVSKALLIDFLKAVNNLSEHPRWYNALTTNCSTAIREQRSHVTELKAWNWKMLANGYLDELAYERGQIDTSLRFADMKKRCFINDRALLSKADSDFSADIRAVSRLGN